MSTVGAVSSPQNTELCAICQDGYTPENPAYSIHPSENDLVSHLFHKACAFNWFSKTPTCPLCKKVILVEATKAGNKSLIQELFAKLVIKDESLDEAIRIAKANNHPECKTFLEESKNIKELIFNAALNNKIELLKEYLNSNLIHPYVREKAAYIAAAKGHKEFLQLLLSNGSVSDDAKMWIAVLALSRGTVDRFLELSNGESNPSFILPETPPKEIRRSELGKSHLECLEVLLAEGPLPDEANDRVVVLAAATGNLDALTCLLYSRPISNESMRGNAVVLAASKYFERNKPLPFLRGVVSAPPPRTGIDRFFNHTVLGDAPVPEIFGQFSNLLQRNEVHSTLKRETEYNYRNCLQLLLNDGSIPEFHRMVALKAATVIGNKSAVAMLKSVDFPIDENNQEIIGGLAQSHNYYKKNLEVCMLRTPVIKFAAAQFLRFAAGFAFDYFMKYQDNHNMPFGESSWYEASLNPNGTYCPNPFLR